MRLTVDGKPHEVTFESGRVTVDDRTFTVRVVGEAPLRTVTVDGRTYRVELPAAQAAVGTVTVDGRAIQVVVEGSRQTPRPVSPARPPVRAEGVVAPGAVIARMAGRILRVDVTAGQEVPAGAVLVILEAMKMENEIRAPLAGTVTEVAVSPGQRVVEGDTLVVIA